MNSDEALQQAADFLPPRRGAVLAITLDTTARPYDISGLTADGVSSLERGHDVYITIQAEGADVFYYFSSATASDLSKTAAITAGAAAAYDNTHPARIVVDQQAHHRLNRAVDKWLILQGSAAGIARLYFSSPTAL